MCSFLESKSELVQKFCFLQVWIWILIFHPTLSPNLPENPPPLMRTKMWIVTKEASQYFRKVLKQNFCWWEGVLQLDLSYWTLSDLFFIDRVIRFSQTNLYIWPEKRQKQNPPKYEIETTESGKQVRSPVKDILLATRLKHPPITIGGGEGGWNWARLDAFGQF